MIQFTSSTDTAWKISSAKQDRDLYTIYLVPINKHFTDNTLKNAKFRELNTVSY